MTNKKGIISGKALISIVVIFAVAVIMVAFIYLSTGAVILKKPSVENIAPMPLPGENILLSQITFTYEDGTKKEAVVFDAVIEATLAQKRVEEINQILQGAGTITQEKREIITKERNQLTNLMSNVKNSIIAEMKKQNSQEEICFFLFQGEKALSEKINLEPNGKDITLKVKNQQTLGENFALELEQYGENGYLISIPEFTATKFGITQTFSIKYFYGECND